ncbi:hypothetical protein CYMTET_22454 [Cymbomonas tetramitiformis]|uniref:Uncharacterized protein n=1 Tax=Cymbomonas tetramitiformis TaxID=36881 RepID=A0AAE0G064_9CHLO|nr:hypothetical protein CYMTET_22454 [Cymbomonas tetramitiformis]
MDDNLGSFVSKVLDHSPADYFTEFIPAEETNTIEEQVHQMLLEHVNMEDSIMKALQEASSFDHDIIGEGLLNAGIPEVPPGQDSLPQESCWMSDSDILKLYEEPLVKNGEYDEYGITVGEVVWYLLSLKEKEKMSDKGFDEFVKVLKFLCGGENCNIPTSLYKMKRYVKHRSVWEYKVDVCPNFCKCYPSTPAGAPKVQEVCGAVLECTDGKPSQWCEEKRYTERSTSNGGTEYISREFFFYLGIKNAIVRWMRDPWFAEMRASKSARSASNRDLWTSSFMDTLNKHSAVSGRLLLEEQLGDIFWRSGKAIEYGEDDAQPFLKDTRYVATYGIHPPHPHGTSFTPIMQSNLLD